MDHTLIQLKFSCLLIWQNQTSISRNRIKFRSEANPMFDFRIIKVRKIKTLKTDKVKHGKIFQRIELYPFTMSSEVGIGILRKSEVGSEFLGDPMALSIKCRLTRIHKAATNSMSIKFNTTIRTFLGINHHTIPKY